MKIRGETPYGILLPPTIVTSSRRTNEKIIVVWSKFRKYNSSPLQANEPILKFQPKEAISLDLVSRDPLSGVY
jgi:hypothetical protein